MDERYRLFDEALASLKEAQRRITEAQEISDLNIAEKTAREALYNLQFTVGGLAYWVQDSAMKRRREIVNRPPVSLEELIKEAPKEEEKPVKKKTTRRRKKNVVQEEE